MGGVTINRFVINKKREGVRKYRENSELIRKDVGRGVSKEKRKGGKEGRRYVLTYVRHRKRKAENSL